MIVSNSNCKSICTAQLPEPASSAVCSVDCHLYIHKQPSAAAACICLLCHQAEFSAAVDQGFQASPSLHQGSIIAGETGAAGPPMSTVSSCSWALTMRQKVGWGDAPATALAASVGSVGGISGGGNGSTQKATAGWLSMLSVFEPHWQVSGCT
jgi:hypothetical protein